MSARADAIILLLSESDTTVMLSVLEWAYKTYPSRWDYATMSEPLRRFYDPKSIRPDSQTNAGPC